MQTKSINGVRVIYEAEENGTAVLIAGTIGETLLLVEEMWGLMPPEKCSIHVMTSWFNFFFRSAPWSWKVLLALTIPFWAPRARRTWPYSAGWTQRYGGQVAIGVKSAALLEKSDKSVGLLMYIEELDPQQKIRQLTCHELVHACSAYLRLPAWLNEGIAVVTVDRCFGKQTIRPDTLELVRKFQPKGTPPSYRELSYLQGETLAYHAVHGYWLVRYLQEKSPGLLKAVFHDPEKLADIEREMANALQMEQDDFWVTIDEQLFAHFTAA